MTRTLNAGLNQRALTETQTRSVRGPEDHDPQQIEVYVCAFRCRVLVNGVPDPGTCALRDFTFEGRQDGIKLWKIIAHVEPRATGIQDGDCAVFQ